MFAVRRLRRQAPVVVLGAMTALRKLAAWVRRNQFAAYGPGATLTLLAIYVWRKYPDLPLLLQLPLFVVAVTFVTAAWVIARYGPALAVSAIAQRAKTDPPPMRTLIAHPAYRAPTEEVRQLPANTLVMEPPPSLIQLEPALDEAPELPAIVVSAPTAPPRFDSLADAPRMIVWPQRNAPRLSFREPIVVGVNEDGEWVTVSMMWRNILIAGEPGSGKSSLMSTFIATAALDPFVKLYLLDGGLVDLAPWQSCAETFVGPDRGRANRLLRSLMGTMEQRYIWLQQRGLKKIEPSTQMPVLVVGIDELAYYTVGVSKEEKDQANEFNGLAADLVRRGRKVGIVVIAATQRPSASVIPTELRNLFGFRVAMRVNMRVDSDIALGTGWARQGFDASTIDAANIGEGFLRHEGATPVRLKACYLDDADVEAIAATSEALRRSGVRSGSEAPPKWEPPKWVADAHEAARSAPEAVAEAVLRAYGAGWSEFRIVRDVLELPSSGEALARNIGLARAIREEYGEARPRLEVVKDEREGSE